jgi:hypothetical protein
MSERLALCETFRLVVLPGVVELAFLDCVNGAADRGEGCPVLARRRRRLDDPATTAPHGAHGVVAAPRCTAAENRSSSAPLALSAVMPLHRPSGPVLPPLWPRPPPLAQRAPGSVRHPPRAHWLGVLPLSLLSIASMDWPRPHPTRR